MNSKWAFIAAAIAPKEIQNDVLTAGITSGLNINTRDRALFNSVQLQSAHTRHEQQQVAAEKSVGVEVLSAVHSLRANNADTNSPEFKAKFSSIERLGLGKHLRKAMLLEDVHGDPLVDDSVRLTNDDLKIFVAGLTRLVSKGQVELTTQEARQFPILKRCLNNQAFKEKVAELVSIAKTEPAPS